MTPPESIDSALKRLLRIEPLRKLSFFGMLPANYYAILTFIKILHIFSIDRLKSLIIHFGFPFLFLFFYNMKTSIFGSQTLSFTINHRILLPDSEFHDVFMSLKILSPK